MLCRTPLVTLVSGVWLTYVGPLVPFGDLSHVWLCLCRPFGDLSRVRLCYVGPW